MGLEVIQVTLSPFQKLEILRQEIDLRGEELKEAEKSIRNIAYELERHKYLQSVHPLFQHLPTPEEAANLPQLHANREALHQALGAMKLTMKTMEAETSGQAAPSSGRQQSRAPGTGGLGNLRKPKFDSFDDFKKDRGT